jgi:hypothetical protein
MFHYNLPELGLDDRQYIAPQVDEVHAALVQEGVDRELDRFTKLDGKIAMEWIDAHISESEE